MLIQKDLSNVFQMRPVHIEESGSMPMGGLKLYRTYKRVQKLNSESCEQIYSMN